jgi:hypothetical protein
VGTEHERTEDGAQDPGTPVGHEYIEHSDGQADQDDADLGQG